MVCHDSVLRLKLEDYYFTFYPFLGYFSQMSVDKNIPRSNLVFILSIVSLKNKSCVPLPDLHSNGFWGEDSYFRQSENAFFPDHVQ